MSVILLLLKLCTLKTIHKSKRDINKYEHFILNNGINVVMITNDKIEKSYCALTVKIGNLNDTIPGIAHFLEHMLFMGTKNYPHENDFDRFLLKNDGETNGSTGLDFTSYHFSINSQFFIEALERFSDFFKEPLLMKIA